MVHQKISKNSQFLIPSKDIINAIICVIPEKSIKSKFDNTSNPFGTKSTNLVINTVEFDIKISF